MPIEHGGAAGLTERSPNKPPLAKAFQFIEGRPSHVNHHSLDGDDKENPQSPSKHASNKSDKTTLDDAPNSPTTKLFPSTPATRLPLAELIGTTDDPDQAGNSVQPSPDECILWHTERSPKQLSAQTKTPTSKGTKRPRSTSPPPPSSNIEDQASFVDLQQHQKHLLKTPRADPATDLWNRYATNTVGNQTDSAPNTNLIPHLPFPASPFSVEESGGNVGGLRRWTSCGIEWPSSRSKRRKTRNHLHPLREALDETSPVQDPNIPGQNNAVPSKSKIGTLIERLQESLARPPELEEPKGPSSSSPLPNANDSFRSLNLGSSSPTNQSKGVLRHAAAEANVAEPEEQAPNDSKLTVVMQQPSSSGFTNEYLDINALDAAEAAFGSGGSKNSTNQAVHTEEERTALLIPPPKPHNGSEKLDNSILKGPSSEAHNDDYDEFDDFGQDLDLSAVEFDTFIKPDIVKLDPSVNVAPQPEAELPSPSCAPSTTGDEFGDEDLDEEGLMAAETAATQPHPDAFDDLSFDSRDHRPTAIQRYRITKVTEGQYITKNFQVQPEKILLVEEEKTKLFKRITLRQSWYDTRCSEGSYVHIIGHFTKGGECLIDDAQNLIILHPDHLVSTTVVADSFGCMRRAVLQDRVKATNESSAAQVYGTILHEIFQEAMKCNQWSTEWLSGTIQTLVERHIQDLYEVKLSIAQAVDYLMSKMPELQSWAQLFVQATPLPGAIVKDRNSKQVTMSVNKLLDVEEHIWSPMYGMKGNIDATVQVVMNDDDGMRNLVVPFEVKTGKNTTNTSHRAQTALYTLLLSDRYDINIAYGILFYLESSEISRIPAIRHELRHMVMQRNELACYIRERLVLPPMLKNNHMCNRCYAKTPCFLYHKLVEDGDGETSGLGETFTKLVQHLQPQHRDFFKKWDDLLTKEESELMKFRRELWTMLSNEREQLGRCFSGVILEEGTDLEEQTATKINRYRYTFRKQEDAAHFAFSESHIAVGEPIVVSDEDGHYALAKGYVVALQKKFVTVAVDRKLRGARNRRPGFDAENNQSFAGIMQIGSSQGTNGVRSQYHDDLPPMRYRLDKDEFSNGLATVRNNLVQVMGNDVFQAREIRNLVVDGVEPRFKSQSTEYNLTGPQSQININQDQRAAIEKILSAEDYALVLGMPGTGKTTTVAHIIRALVAKGKSILLASYTHSAVDNILLKIRDDKIGILRLGAVAKVHPAVQEFAMLAAEPRYSMQELEKIYHEPQIVATTCLGISHPLFNERTFDYCIVDEASQITLPVCLGPIRMAKAFVLVGDHYQLPPLVQNREALEGGLDVSLFKLLSERHPSAVVELQHQYRMNEAIMSLSSKLIYGGRLKCGSEEIAHRFLEVPDFEALSTVHDTCSTNRAKCISENSSSCWLNRSLGPSSPPVVFINTDTLDPECREIARGARITNPPEAELLIQLIQALLLTGVAPESIGAITLYRSQLALLKSLLQHRVTPSQLQQLEVHTTDRFQGRDKDVVIVSCVRSNNRGVVGDLLKDWRRVNVAMTRAKRKLIMIGSKSTLASGDELLGKLITMCDENGWIVDLAANAADERAHSWSSTFLGSSMALSGGKQPRQPTEGAEGLAETAQQATTLPTTAAPSITKQGTGYVNQKFKPPTKTGKVTANAVLGVGSGSIKNKRPVLADIINDALGEID